jgi:hypothetical protein
LIGYVYNFAFQRDLTLPYVDDGLFEVVGFRDAWHGLVLFAPNGHGTRLAQVSHIGFVIPVMFFFNSLSLSFYLSIYGTTLTKSLEMIGINLEFLKVQPRLDGQSVFAKI